MKGILAANLRQKLSKDFDMRYWWIKDRIKQRQFELVWEPGKENRANYFTKYFPPKHHLLQRHIFLQQAESNHTVRVCYSVNRYKPLQKRLLLKPLQTVTNRYKQLQTSYKQLQTVTNHLLHKPLRTVTLSV